MRKWLWSMQLLDSDFRYHVSMLIINLASLLRHPSPVLCKSINAVKMLHELIPSGGCPTILFVFLLQSQSANLWCLSKM